MTSPSMDAFGSDFLPGKDNRTQDDATRAMERRYGGSVGYPFNDADASWENNFTDRQFDGTHEAQSNT